MSAVSSLDLIEIRASFPASSLSIDTSVLFNYRQISCLENLSCDSTMSNLVIYSCFITVVLC